MQKLLVFLMFLIPLMGKAQQLKLSDQAEVSIITCGPGAALDALFGHNAIRIHDPVWGIDETYGYGSFDFSTPNFYLKFTQGKLMYEADKIPFNRFVQGYQYENRWIYEQVLDLDSLSKQEIYDFVEWNILPENKKYKYDFFFDNCATKMRDIVKDVVGADLVFSGDYLTEKRSFRDLLREMNGTMPWISLGMDIALGAPIDPKATAEEHMFLPNYVLSGYDNAAVMKNGIARPAIKSERMIFQPVETDDKKGLMTPMVIFSVLLLLVLGVTYKDYKSKKRTKIIDFLLFLLTGLVGVTVILLWTATEHAGMRNNLNVLWAFAPNLVVAFYMLKDNPPKWVRSYARILFILLIMMVLIWTVGIQVYSTALIPFVLLIGIRYFFLWQKGLVKA
jgi:Domain of unknown function (DUF4105)